MYNQFVRSFIHHSRKKNYNTLKNWNHLVYLSQNEIITLSNSVCFYVQLKPQIIFTTTVLWPFFRDQPGELVPEGNSWTLWCKGRLTDHRPSGWTHSIRTNQCPPPPSPHFLQAGCPFWHPTNSVKAM